MPRPDRCLDSRFLEHAWRGGPRPGARLILHIQHDQAAAEVANVEAAAMYGDTIWFDDRANVFPFLDFAKYKAEKATFGRGYEGGVDNGRQKLNAWLIGEPGREQERGR